MCFYSWTELTAWRPQLRGAPGKHCQHFNALLSLFKQCAEWTRWSHWRSNCSPSLTSDNVVHLYLLQIAAKMGQLGVYMPAVLNNPGSGGSVQSLSQAAGVTHQEKADGVSSVGVLPAGVQQKQALRGGSGGSPCSNNLPAGLRRAGPKANIVHTHGESKVWSTLETLSETAATDRTPLQETHNVQSVDVYIVIYMVWKESQPQSLVHSWLFFFHFVLNLLLCNQLNVHTINTSCVLLLFITHQPHRNRKAQKEKQESQKYKRQKRGFRLNIFTITPMNREGSFILY